MVHIILASKGCLTSSTNQTFFFAFFCFLLAGNTTPCHPCLHQQLFLLSQIFYDGRTSMPDRPYSYALFCCNGNTTQQKISVFIFSIFCFLIIFFLIIFIFRAPFVARFLPYLHHCSYCLLYAPKALSFSTFSSFLSLIFL